jgi:hypothetical protein
MEQSDTKGIPGTVVCGVCGAVRRYSFILQARKFGTFSCEPCRKFISRVLRARVPVKCSVGNGACINPPVHRWTTNFPTEDKPSIPMPHLMEMESPLIVWSFLLLFLLSRWRSDDGPLQSLLAETSPHGISDAWGRPRWSAQAASIFHAGRDSVSSRPPNRHSLGSESGTNDPDEVKLFLNSKCNICLGF